MIHTGIYEIIIILPFVFFLLEGEKKKGELNMFVLISWHHWPEIQQYSQDHGLQKREKEKEAFSWLSNHRAPHNQMTVSPCHAWQAWDCLLCWKKKFSRNDSAFSKHTPAGGLCDGTHRFPISPGHSWEMSWIRHPPPRSIIFWPETELNWTYRTVASLCDPPSTTGSHTSLCGLRNEGWLQRMKN